MLKAEQQTQNACEDNSVNSAKQPNITNNFLDEGGHLAFNQESSRGQSSALLQNKRKAGCYYCVLEAQLVITEKPPSC